MFKLLLSVSILLFAIKNGDATVCHELQQSQLISLNERMSQIIDSISSLLPKSTLKSTPSKTPPAVHSIDSRASQGYEATNASPSYVTPTSTPQIMYVSPSYGPPPTPVFFAPPVHPSPVQSLPHYPQPETVYPDYPFPPSSLVPGPLPRYQYEHYPLTQYVNPIPSLPYPTPTYTPVSYSFAPPQYTPEPNYAYPSEHSVPIPIHPSLPSYPPIPAYPSIPAYPPVPSYVPLPSYPSSQPPFPSPIYTASNYSPTYPNYSEMQTPKYV